MNAFVSSTAVMARRVEPADSLDFFPTPPWATRAFCHHVLPRFERRTEDGRYWLTARDPACGEGHMAAALGDYFSTVSASDIFPYGFGTVADFLHPECPFVRTDWVITNPPFNLGAEFVRQALRVATRGVAMLVRMQFLEGEGRYAEIFRDTPPALIAQFVERVPMHKGRWVVNGTTATAYAWLVWLGHQPKGDPRFMWIPKSRKLLSRHDDWLRFGGCWDLEKKHPAMKLIDAQGRQHALSLEAVRANMKMDRPTPATIGDVARAMGALL